MVLNLTYMWSWGRTKTSGKSHEYNLVKMCTWCTIFWCLCIYIYVYSIFSPRRTLYPPWRTLQYQTFQGRTLTMALGRLLEVKENLLGLLFTTSDQYNLHQFLVQVIRHFYQITSGCVRLVEACKGGGNFRTLSMES